MAKTAKRINSNNIQSNNRSKKRKRVEVNLDKKNEIEEKEANSETIELSKNSKELRKNKLAPQTQKNYQSGISKFLNYCQNKNIDPLKVNLETPKLIQNCLSAFSYCEKTQQYTYKLF